MRRVTLKDLARRLGLSQATVSRALRDDPKIPPVTRNRVKSEAEELNYRPNALMSELAACRWQTAGVASGSVMGYVLQNPPKSNIGALPEDFIGPAREQAALLGYGLEVFSQDEFASPGKIQKALINRGVTDLILGPAFDKSFMMDFDWKNFIAVQVIPGRFRLPLHSVFEDHFANVTLAWENVVSHGYRRIGIVLMDHGFRLFDDMARLGAVHVCQTQLSPELPSIAPFYLTPEDHRDKDFIRWVKKNEVDAIIGFSGSQFHVFRQAFGYAIPYALLNKNSGAPEFSGILDPTQSLGREGVNLLHFCRRTHQWGIPKQRIEHIIEPTWFEGETLPMKKTA